MFADLPADLVGVAGGAWLHEIHARLRDKLRRRTEQILRERDVQDVIELSPNMAVALIAGAQEEGREELMELWARLLANAMDPKNALGRAAVVVAAALVLPAVHGAARAETLPVPVVAGKRSAPKPYHAEHPKS